MNINKVDFTFAFLLLFFLLLGKKMMVLELIESSRNLSLAVYICLFLSSFAFIKKTFIIAIIATCGLPFFITGEFNSFGLHKIINVLIAIMAITSFYITFENKIQLRRALIYFAAMLASYIVLVLIYMFFFQGWNATQRVIMGLNGPITFSRFNFLVSLIFLIYLQNKNKNKIIWVGVFSGIGITMASKGPILGYLIAVLYFNFKNITIKKIITVFVIFILTTAIIENYSPRLFQFISDVSQIIITQDTSVAFSQNNNGSLGTRWEEAVHSLKVFISTPVGIGPGNWGDYGKHIYPHNLVLEVLVEFGVMGVLMIVVLTISTFQIKNRELKTLILFLFINALVSGSFADNIFLFSLIIIGKLNDKQQKSNFFLSLPCNRGGSNVIYSTD